MVEKKEEEASTSLNVVILPDEQTAEQAIGLSHAVSERFGTEFVLDHGLFKPHITLYQGHYPDRNIPALLQRLAAAAQDTRAIPVTMAGFEVVAKEFVFWNSRRDGVLQLVHEGVMTLANPLREGLLPDVAVNMLPDQPEEVQRRMRETGSMLTGPHFHPHITITKALGTQNAQEAAAYLASLQLPPVHFTADRISIGHLGDHGIVSDIIDEFSLAAHS